MSTQPKTKWEHRSAHPKTKQYRLQISNLIIIRPLINITPVFSPRAELGIFICGGQVTELIYLSRQPPHTHIYTHFYIFLLYTHTFLFDKLYIYTHPTKKKNNLVLLIKIIFNAIFQKINKIHFYHFHSEILKKFHFLYKLSNFILM